MFKIVQVSRIDSDSVSVKVTMDAKAWREMSAKGQLGSLYGVDISNAAYREYGVMAQCPSVDDFAKAKGGIKVIELIYADSQWNDNFDNVIYVDFVSRRRAA
jgi:hypothetical protein